MKKSARKIATNLSIRNDIVKEAKALDLNLSELFEAVVEAVRRRRREPIRDARRGAAHAHEAFGREAHRGASIRPWSSAGAEYAILLQELAAIPLTAIGDPVGNLRQRRDELIAALDLLFTGI